MRRGRRKEGDIGEGHVRVRGGNERLPLSPFLLFSLFLCILMADTFLLLPVRKAVQSQQCVNMPQVYFAKFFLTLTPTPFVFAFCLYIHTSSSWNTGVTHGHKCKYIAYCMQKYSIHTYTSRSKYSFLSSGDLQFIFKHSIFRLQRAQLVFYQRDCKREWNREIKRKIERRKEREREKPRGNRESITWRSWPTRSSIYSSIPHSLKAELPGPLIKLSLHPPVLLFVVLIFVSPLSYCLSHTPLEALYFPEVVHVVDHHSNTHTHIHTHARAHTHRQTQSHFHTLHLTTHLTKISH